MKIFICAIMKNEEKNVCRFYESCKDADGIYVLDTGSTDNSVKLMQSMGNNVLVTETKYDKFRFDVARNDAIAMLPKEDAWVIHLDIDEFLVGDWKAELSALTDATNVSYMYVFNRLSDGQPGVHFIANKITRNGLYRFKFPIHENIYTDKPEVKYHTQKFHIEQEQDKTKTRNYRDLLEEAVKEYPTESILKFYLLKEYFIAGNYGKCVDVATEMTRTSRTDYSMVACLIAARSFEALGAPHLKEEWLLRGVDISPFRREAYMELLRLYTSQNRPEDAFWAANNLFHIRNRPFDFLEMTEAWSKEPHAIFADVCTALGFLDIRKEHVLILNDVMPMRRGVMRDGLLDLIQQLGGKDIVMAEVGSYAGESSEIFAASKNISKVYAIDPWCDDIQCEHVTFKNMAFVEQLFDERNGKNPKIVKMKTDGTTAVNAIESVDFVYLDALHTYEAIVKDIENWYAKVKPGGWLGGHDYHAEGFPGVYRAVNEFCEKNDLPRPFVFRDSSWLMRKPK
jgi:glycosyltransferase involved in cell wall biosynthesis